MEIQIQVALAGINAKRTRNLTNVHSGDSQAMDLEDLRGRLSHGWNRIGRTVISRSL